MNARKIIAAALLLASAGTQAAQVIEYEYRNGNLWLRLDDAPVQPDCVIDPVWHYRTTAATADAAMAHALVLGAENGFAFDIRGTGTCAGDVELIKSFTLTPLS